MRKIILIFTVFTFTCLSSKCLAQKVLANQNIGGVTYLAVIDNGTLPLGTIKTPSELSSQKTSDRINRHTESDEINKKISRRFAVTKVDISGARGMNWAEASGWNLSPGGNNIGAIPANTGCPMYYDGLNIGKWRLPTQRELMLIYQMRSELEAIDGFYAFMSVNYWSSTEHSNGSNYVSNSWYINFKDGSVNDNGYQGEGIHVRCIRDL